jgi:hypothetical protein
MDKLKTARASRRSFLRLLAYGGTGLALLATTYGVGRLTQLLGEQAATWQKVTCDAPTFLTTYGPKLARLHLGANLCPDYKLLAAGADPARTVRLLKEYFGCTHVRLGMRWNTHAEQGLAAYNRWIEALLNQGIETILAYGVKAPFPPETHFPPTIEENLAALGVNRGDTIYADSPLGQLGLEYTQGLLAHLESEFGLASFAGFNPENEFDAHYGKHALGIGEDLLYAHAQLLATPQQRRRLLINTALIAPPNRPASLTTVVQNAVALRQAFPTLETLVGADVYEETAAGRLSPNAYVDTFAGVRLRHGDGLIPSACQRLAAAGIPLEVTEFQISEWIREPRLHEPGSRIHFQYLLARVLDYLLAEPPATANKSFVIRLWEMSTILLNLLYDETFFYENETHLLIQAINRLG